MLVLVKPFHYSSESNACCFFCVVISGRRKIIVSLFSRSIEGIEIENIQRRMFEPLKHLTHM